MAMDSKILQQISRKGSNKEQIAAKVINQPELLSETFEGLNSDEANIKYGCDKILRLISEKAPELLYPHFDFFANNLNSENTFLKWGAIHILANLAAVDAENKFERIFDKYFAPIPGPVLITAANVIKGAAKIALAKPHLAERIAQTLLQVEKAKYQNAACRNIALGQVIKTAGQFFDQIKDKEPVVKLIRRQLKNSRNATKKVAEKFLRKNL
jgi:hypothetical protein